MAAVSLLGSSFTTTAGSKSVTATPAAGDLIVIVGAHAGAGTPGATPTDNQSGTYSLVGRAIRSTNPNFVGMYVRDALIPSAVSTIFTHAPGATDGGGLAVIKITGMSKAGLTALLQADEADSQAAGTTPTATLAAAPQSGNPVIGALLNASNPANVSPRAGYSELADLGHGSPAHGIEVMSRDSGEASATLAWGGTSASLYALVVAEFDASASGANHAGNAALSGTGTLAAAGLILKLAASALSGFGTLAASALATLKGALTAAGAGTISASASLDAKGTGALAGTGTLGASPAVTRSAAAAVAGAGTLAALATVSRSGSVSLNGVGNLAATGSLESEGGTTHVGSASAAGQGTLAAAGQVTRPASAALLGAGSLAASALRQTNGSAALSGSGSLGASAVRALVASAMLDGAGTVALLGRLQRNGSASLAGAGSLEATGRTGFVGVTPDSRRATVPPRQGPASPAGRDGAGEILAHTRITVVPGRGG